MGHVRMGVLPRSQAWTQVVNELQLGADAETIAALSAKAAETALRNASSDPAFLHAFWLLTQIPLAARGPDFSGDLQRLGVDIGDGPSLVELIGAVSDAIDDHARNSGGRTDLGEMAQMAAVESLTAIVGASLPSLFSPNLDEVQVAIGRLAGGDRFRVLAREFFARLTQRSLGYFLSRELGSHIGTDERFVDDGARSRFDQALEQHCREASRIVEEFAGGWYGKNIYQGDGLTPESIRRFAPVAFKKIRNELRNRRDVQQ